MALNLAAPLERAELRTAYATTESSLSAVSWGAILAGAAVAASLTLVLTVLGVGLGLSSVSPWSGSGASATAIGSSAVMWLVFSEAIAAGLGGYLAGRLRVKWVNVHGDEVYFRDTAHGLLVWAVGVALTAAFLTSALSSVVGTASKVVATGVAGAAAVRGGGAMPGGAAASTSTVAQSATNMASGSAYLTDSLFRSDRASTDNSQTAHAELGRILAESVRNGSFAPADRTYAAQVIAAQTGLTQAEAEQRVDTVYTKAKTAAADAETAAREAADKARSAAAKTSLWIFVALLVGAFCASVAATIGGNQRDRALAIG